MNPDRRPWWETAIDVVETIGAAVACAALASLPLWAAILVGLAAPTLGPLTFVVGVVAVVVLPAAPAIAGRPELDAAGRWGTRMGRFVGAPLRWSAQRRGLRNHRALGAATSTSSTAAPSLPPRA